MYKVTDLFVILVITTVIVRYNLKIRHSMFRVTDLLIFTIVQI